MNKIPETGLPKEGDSSRVSMPIWAETKGESCGVTPSSDGTSGAFHGGSGDLDADTLSGAGGNVPFTIDRLETSESTLILTGDETVISSASSISNAKSKKTKKKRNSGSQKRKKLLERLAAAREANELRKRKMVETDNETNPEEPKRPKTHGNFSAIAVKMAIIPEDASKNITPEMVNPIRTAIWEMLESTQDPLPVINAGTLVSGVLHISCEGAASAQWLRGLNGRIVEGVRLKVISAKDLPKPAKMAWKTRNTWCLDASRLLNIIQRFNPSICTKDWKIVNTSVEESHVRRIVLMDKASADYIKARGYYLQSGMDRSMFKLLEEPDGTVLDTELTTQPSTATSVDLERSTPTSDQDELDMLNIWET